MLVTTAVTLPPHDPTAHCPKCGYSGVSTVFCTKGRYADQLHRWQDSAEPRPHLDRYCRCCGYQWCEAVRDDPAAAPPADAAAGDAAVPAIPEFPQPGCRTPAERKRMREYLDTWGYLGPATANRLLDQVEDLEWRVGELSAGKLTQVWLVIRDLDGRRTVKAAYATEAAARHYQELCRDDMRPAALYVESWYVAPGSSPKPAGPEARRFRLVRDEDVSGVSGTGVVAEGVAFTTGKVVISWLSEHGSVVVWDSLESAIAVHGHGGRARPGRRRPRGRAPSARAAAPAWTAASRFVWACARRATAACCRRARRRSSTAAWTPAGAGT